VLCEIPHPIAAPAVACRPEAETEQDGNVHLNRNTDSQTVIEGYPLGQAITSIRAPTIDLIFDDVRVNAYLCMVSIFLNTTLFGKPVKYLILGMDLSDPRYRVMSSR
jgi:hypothetical protein